MKKSRTEIHIPTKVDILPKKMCIPAKIRIKF